jgi:hypothetical protein
MRSREAARSSMSGASFAGEGGSCAISSPASWKG